MSYPRWREEFIAQFCGSFDSAGSTIGDARALLRAATSLQRSGEIQCSIDVGERENARLEKRDERAQERVRKIVAEQLGVNEADIKNESSFVDDLGADSLDTVELVMALEEEFETEIPDEEAEKITTVQQAIDYVTKASSKA